MQLVYAVGDSHYFKDSNGAIVQCNTDSTVVSPIEYGDSYFDKWAGMDFSKIEAITKIRFRLISMFCEGCKSLLDYGCGTGEFVLWSRLVFPSNVYVAGYDVESFSYNKADTLTLTPHTVDFKDLTGQFDVVTLFDSLEHLQDPSIVFKLDPNWFIVSVPNTDKRLLEDKSRFLSWRHYRPNEHIWYFDKYSLTNLFQSNGYRRLFCGYPEDTVRTYEEQEFPNILTAVFVKE